MRIGYLTADFGVPVLGSKGASAHVRGLVRALQRDDHEVLVLAANVGDGAADATEFPVEQLPFGASLLELYEALKQERVCQGTRLAKDLRNLLYALSLELQGRVLLHQCHPDFIYERYCLFSTAGVELAHYFDVPFILEVNAPLVLEQEKMRGLSLPEVASTAERLLFKKADHVVVVSDWLRQYVIREGVDPARVTVIPNAADPEVFRPQDRRLAVRSRFGWHEEFVFGFVGSMKSWHGVSTMLEALSLLGGAESSFRVLLVGSGPDLPRLEAEIERRRLDSCVRLTGAVPQEQVPELIEAMDAVIAPYSPDADAYFSPVKLFEYMAMARPIVAARIGQTGVLIEHGRTGWLYGPGDAGELARLVQMLSANPQLCECAAAAARECVLAHHTWAHNARQVVSIAESIIERRRQSSGDNRVRVA
jgi:glycosyltransferase involved in cell wall biosynthesis